MLWFQKPIQEPTREELISFAARYFYKYLDGLSAGTVKAKLGRLNVSVAFTVDEEERE